MTIKDNKTIFINIAAYRDPTLTRTLTSALENAKNPQNLIFAVGLQYYDEEIPDLTKIPSSQIKIIKYDVDTRPGVVRVRYELNKLFNNEDYFLMIDSHMEFEKHWDVTLINALDELSILGNCRVGLSNFNDLDNGQSVVSSLDFQLGENIVLLKECFKRLEPKKFLLTNYIRCNFLFTFGNFCTEVGLDPYSQEIQEEFYLSFKTFMLGWDIYQYADQIVRHTPNQYYKDVWGDQSQRKFSHRYRDSWQSQWEFSMAYVYNDFSKYAIKNAKRTLHEFYSFFNIIGEYAEAKELMDSIRYNNIIDA